MPKIIGTLTTSSSHGKAVTTNSIFDEDKQKFQSQINAEVEERLSNISTSGGNGMSISGTFNLVTATGSEYSSIFSSMSVGDMRMYLVTDSNGNLPSTNQTAITVKYDGILSPAFIYFGKSADFGVSVGDILVFAKLNLLTNVCRIIPLNDVKPSSNSFPGADGLSTVWDKIRINKVDGIEWTVNYVRDNYLPKSDLFPSKWESNMNNALTTGVYPWCTLGRPSGATGAFTCLVNRTSTNDGSYDTIEQTAYGREGELGQIWKRIIFYKSDGTDTQYGLWIAISGDGSSDVQKSPAHGRLDIATDTFELSNDIINLTPIGFVEIHSSDDDSINEVALSALNGDSYIIIKTTDYNYMFAENEDGEWVLGIKESNYSERFATKNEVATAIANAITNTLNTEV